MSFLRRLLPRLDDQYNHAFHAFIDGIIDSRSDLSLGQAAKLRGYESRTIKGDSYEEGWNIETQLGGFTIYDRIRSLFEYPFICVIGRGHSGTRLISHTLKASGVCMGYYPKDPYSNSGDYTPADALYSSCKKFAEYVQYAGDLEWCFDTAVNMEPTDEFISLIYLYMERLLDFRGELKGWKLPETTLIYPWIVKLFPNTRFIHWVRDPRDVILSNHNTDNLKDWNVAYDYCPNDVLYNRAVSWKYQHDIVEMTPRPNHFIRVRFEDFVLDQDNQLERLYKFLGIKLVSMPVNKEPVGRWKYKDNKCYHFLKKRMQQYDYE